MKKGIIKKIGIGFSLIVVLAISAFTNNYFEISKNLEIFATLYREINLFYVDDTQPGDLMKTGIDAMLKSLDPYTTYIPESRIEDYKFMTTGQYGGIGALIRKVDSSIYVAEPYEGFPAEKAGLSAGDILLAVDGVPVGDKSTSEISELLRGQAGAELAVTVLKNGQTTPTEVSLTREEIKVADVPYSGMLNEEVGYIKLNGFHQTASSEVKEALNNLKEKHQASKIILDLRGNGGGLLREAVRIVNLFVKQDELVVRTKGKTEDWNKEHRTFEQPVDTEIPLVVLIDGGSASASEIVAGALQDLDRAVIVGEESFGKGLVQQTHDLNYNAKLKITVAKYYIPSGRCIQRLDYSNRDEKGRVSDVPDSLLKSFKTKNGRVVKDGRGIAPDVAVNPEPYASIVTGLAAESIFFKYANRYVVQNDSLQDVATFTISKEEYEAFCAFLNKHQFDYETQTSALIADLEEVSKKEDYYEKMAPEIKKLQSLFAQQKSLDLDLFSHDIKEVLGNEIVSRYFYQKGRIQYALQSDQLIDTAISYLDQQKYQSVLVP